MGDILEMFKDVLMQCQLKYDKHEDEKGDSWKEECTIHYLNTKLIYEIEEFCSAHTHSQEEFNELIDVILVAMMLAQRLFPELVKKQIVQTGGG